MSFQSTMTQVLKQTLVGGSIFGVVEATLSGAKVVSVKAPRQLLTAMLGRDDTNESGIYLLYGPDESRQRVYVGKGNIRDRISYHARTRKMKFFTHVIYFVIDSKRRVRAEVVDELERIMIERLRETKRADFEVENKVTPRKKEMFDEDVIEAEGMMRAIETMLPALNFELLNPINEDEHPLELEGSGYTKWKFERETVFKAEMSEFNGEYLLLKGSTIKPIDKDREGMNTDSYARRRCSEMGRTVKVKQDGYFVTQHIPFDSPSGAASFVSGGSENGWRVWRDGNTNEPMEAVENARLEKWQSQNSNEIIPSRNLKPKVRDNRHSVIERASSQSVNIIDNVGMMRYKARGLDAWLEKRGGKEFVLVKGSVIKPVDERRMKRNESKPYIRRRVNESERLMKVDGRLITLEDISFDYISQAAEFVCGTSKSGNEFWIEDNGNFPISQ